VAEDDAVETRLFGTSLTACTFGGSVSGISEAGQEEVKKKEPSSLVVSAIRGLERLKIKRIPIESL
jgi:hypothetical protein